MTVDIPLPIETERFSIRPLSEDDAEAVHEIWSDPEVMRYIPSAPSASLEESETRLARHLGTLAVAVGGGRSGRVRRGRRASAGSSRSRERARRSRSPTT